MSTDEPLKVLFGSVLIVAFAPLILAYCYWWWNEISDYRKAVGESNEYRSGLEDEIVNEWAGYNGNATAAIRKEIHDYDVRETMVNREESWALIPYAESLLTTLQQGALSP